MLSAYEAQHCITVQSFFVEGGGMLLAKGQMSNGPELTFCLFVCESGTWTHFIRECQSALTLLSGLEVLHPLVCTLRPEQWVCVAGPQLLELPIWLKGGEWDHTKLLLLFATVQSQCTPLTFTKNERFPSSRILLRSFLPPRFVLIHLHTIHFGCAFAQAFACRPTIFFPERTLLASD